MLRGWWKRIGGLLLVAALAIAGTLSVRAVWAESERVHDDLLVPAASPEPVAVLAVDGATVTLPRTDLTQADGVWGLRWDGGYGRLGPVRDVTTSSVTRSFTAMAGELAAGTGAVVEAAAFPPGPNGVHAFTLEEISLTGELGELPAWLVRGEGTRWAVVVHGRFPAARAQSHRILPMLNELGYTVLVPTYRNDEGAPADRDGRYRWGSHEWRDLDVAVRYAINRGADELVIVGYDMGATITGVFLEESAFAERVTALVFDSAVYDPGAAADRFAAERGTQRWVATAARAVVSLRFDMKWSAVDLIDRAARITVPTLVLHGSDDRMVPVADALAFVEALPDLAILQVIPGGRHAALWNADPGRYEALVAEFLHSLDDDADGDESDGEAP